MWHRAEKSLAILQSMTFSPYLFVHHHADGVVRIIIFLHKFFPTHMPHGVLTEKDEMSLSLFEPTSPRFSGCSTNWAIARGIQQSKIDYSVVSFLDLIQW